MREAENFWYHAVGYYGKNRRFWWNRKRDDLISDVLFPFVGKQIRHMSRNGVPSLFNFGATDYITILKTSKRLNLDSKRRPKELAQVDFIEKHCATKEFLEDIKALNSSPRTRSLLEQSITTPKKQIFVIMQFSNEELDSAYEGVIKQVGESYGYIVTRVDRIQDSGNINQQILENIATSSIVLADLTGERPNCYYEAGFAHAIGKEMIFAAKEGTSVHFDLSGYRFIRWRTEAHYRQQLTERMESLTQKGSA